MTMYLTNSPGVFTSEKSLVVKYFDLTQNPDRFCSLIRSDYKNGSLVSAIGHPAVAEMISAVCGIPVKANRQAISLKPGDASCGITLSFRPEPGQEFSRDDMLRFIKEGKVKLFCMYTEPSTEEAFQKLEGQW